VPGPSAFRRDRAFQPPGALRPGDDGSWSAFAGRRSRWGDRLRIARRVLLIVLWTLPCMAVQAILVALPGRLDRRFARLYWAGMCRLMSLSRRVLGTPAHRTAGGRPVVFVSTHSSWLDILVLGATLEASFIAKAEIGSWPLVNLIAGLGRTVYVRRTRASTAREALAMRDRLARGDSLILFPEGTTSDGAHVLPFRSAFLSVAEYPVAPGARTPIVQPVSLVYDRHAGLPLGRASRTRFAWIGDQDILSSFLAIATERGLRATVLLHEPLDPARFASRKDLTAATWRIAAEGSATLRQNRL
jgi:1-acyl-sn-glycerol-3-phosphate acyltransferase